MTGNQQTKDKRKAFEIATVLIVIALLIGLSHSYYRKPVERSQQVLVEHHAAVFSRMVSSIHALGSVRTDGRVHLEGTTFYLNEYGWPANTERGRSPSWRNQSVEECMQLWRGVFRNPPVVVAAEAAYNQNAEYRVSLHRNIICRYETTDENFLYAIDFHLVKGNVSLSPLTEIQVNE